MWRDLAAGLAMVWRRHPRSCYAYWAWWPSSSWPLQWPCPCWPANAWTVPALGLLMGAHGAGTWRHAGLRLGGAWLRRHFGAALLAADAVVACLLMALGKSAAPGKARPSGRHRPAVRLLQVAIFTWIQRRVAPAMLGRAMALFMAIFLGLAPLSAAATGALLAPPERGRTVLRRRRPAAGRRRGRRPMDRHPASVKPSASSP
jgi:hypothetical protein